jgi:hypothetical protein
MDPVITKGVAESPFPITYSAAVLDVVKVIRAHFPSLTTEAEAEIDRRYLEAGEEGLAYADAAYRICACGQPIDGFYEYVHHLVVLFGGGESHLDLIHAFEQVSPEAHEVRDRG